MSEPVGSHPSPDEIESYAKSHFAGTRFGPLSVERVGSTNIIFTSRTYPVQFELIFEDDMSAVTYKVYEIPQPGETFADKTFNFDKSFNPDMSWPNALTTLFMTIEGCINGGVNRTGIQPREGE